MKRFTETNKWRDPWYRKLSSPSKQLWEFLCDNCDSIGLIDLDFSLVSNDCGQKITESNMEELGDRVQHLGDGRFFIRKFIQFQYGELTESCPPHRSVIKQVEQHNLVRVGLGYDYPNARVGLGLPQPLRQDKKGKGQEEGVQGETGKHPTLEEVRMCCSKTGLPESDADWFWHKCEANGWTNGGHKIKSWQHTIGSWKAAGYMPSQKQNGAASNRSSNLKPWDQQPGESDKDFERRVMRDVY